ncbi:MAG TPA: homocysteine S-methyltransferase family protein [Bryobacteraceae bacterium]|nr:homocysteine S-methyltransferase family protein [Bryobacteraceae bacterium]
MDFARMLANEPAVLTEGAVVERLRRDPLVELNPLVAHAAFPANPATAAALGGIYKEYLEIGRAARLPMICTTPTWRANPERTALAGLDTRAVNIAAVRFLLAIREEYEGVWVGALMGCRGDAYRPEEALGRAEAARFHAVQVAALAEAGPNFLFAATMPEASEAAGMAEAMARSGLPYIISFIIKPEGCLLDGTPVTEAIRRIDAEVSPAPLAYFVNCVHPSAMHVRHPRLLGFQGNTSRKPPHQLEGLPELDTEEPAEFARAVLALGGRCGLRVFGGCCGTDARHIRAIAGGLQPTSAIFGSGVNVRESLDES